MEKYISSDNNERATLSLERDRARSSSFHERFIGKWRQKNRCIARTAYTPIYHVCGSPLVTGQYRLVHGQRSWTSLPSEKENGKCWINFFIHDRSISGLLVVISSDRSIKDSIVSRSFERTVLASSNARFECTSRYIFYGTRKIVRRKVERIIITTINQPARESHLRGEHESINRAQPRASDSRGRSTIHD